MAATAITLTGCADSSRFADPFGNPFGSAEQVDRSPTGSVPPTRRVVQDRTAQDRSVQERIVGQPLSPAPQRTASIAPVPAAPTNAPVVSSSNWTSQGGTPVVMAQGETPKILADRYGVPLDALVRTNGYASTSQINPGARIIIPVYSVGASRTAAAATPVVERPRTPAPAPVAAAPQKETLKLVRGPQPAATAQRAKDEDRAEQKKAQPTAKAKLLERTKSARVKADDEDDAPATRKTVAAQKVVAPVERVKTARAKTDDDDDAAPAAKKAQPVAKAVKPVERPKLAANKVEADDDDAPVVKKAQAGAKAKLLDRTKTARAKTADDEDDAPAAKVKKPSAPVRHAAAREEVAKPEKAAPPKVARVEPVKAEKPVVQTVARAEPKPAATVQKVTREETSKPEKVVAPKVAQAEKPVVQKIAPAEKPVVAKVAQAEKPAEKAEKKPAIDPAPVASLPTAESKADKGGEKTADASNPEFRWPARGRVIQSFKTGGNDGINIAVPEGTAVKAAEDGVVAYAGSELKGYGNLVLIRHPNGFVSAYANNGSLDVKRGDPVKRGQTIAKSGQTGNVSSPQLHFELRKGAQPVDPAIYLAGN